MSFPDFNVNNEKNNLSVSKNTKSKDLDIDNAFLNSIFEHKNGANNHSYVSEKDLSGFNELLECAEEEHKNPKDNRIFGDELYNMPMNEIDNGQNNGTSTYEIPNPQEMFGSISDTYNMPMNEVDNGPSTYEIQNSQQVVDLRREAVKYLGKLPKETADTYKELIRNIRYDENGNMDTNHTDTLKAFLALKKIVKYEGEMPAVDNNRINETTPLLGVYHSEYDLLKQTANNNPELESSLSNLYQSIYGDSDAGDSRHIIPKEQLEEANKIASQLLKEEMEKYNMDDASKLFEYSDFWPGVTFTYDTDNEYNDWCVKMVIQKGGYGNETNHTPEAVVLLHELYHVKQAKPGEKENKDDFVELGATINDMITRDKIYKKVNNIDINKEIAYPNSEFKLPNGETINLGTIANTFREIMQENNYETVEEALISPKGQEFLMKYYSL